MKRVALRIPLNDHSVYSPTRLPPPRDYVEAIADGQIRIEPPPYQKPEQGRPPHIATSYTRRQVELLMAYGIQKAAIAHIIGISVPTLDKHYEQELKHGLSKANAVAAARLFDIATRGQGKEAVTALIFWLKTRAKFVDQRVDINHTGNIHHEHDHLVDATVTLSHEDRAARVLQIFAAGTAGGAGSPALEHLRTMVASTRPPAISLQLPG